MPIVTDGMAILPSIVRTIQIRSAENILDLVETDQTDPAGRWRWFLNGDKVYLRRATTANWGSYEDWLVYDKANEKFTFGKLLESTKGIRRQRVSKTGTYTATVDDHYIECDASGGAFTVTLPTASTAKAGFILIIQKIDSSANAVTIDGHASETINGQTTYTLKHQYQLAHLICDGSNWYVIGEKTVRSATKIVAASDSDPVSKAQADYVCHGVHDNVEIQAAIDALMVTTPSPQSLPSPMA